MCLASALRFVADRKIGLKLEKLWMGANPGIGPVGMAAIARSFEAGALPNLREMLLWGNGLGADGVAALAAAFTAGSLQQLEMLDVRMVSMGDQGAASIAALFDGEEDIGAPLADFMFNGWCDGAVDQRFVAYGAEPETPPDESCGTPHHDGFKIKFDGSGNSTGITKAGAELARIGVQLAENMSWQGTFRELVDVRRSRSQPSPSIACLPHN